MNSTAAVDEFKPDGIHKSCEVFSSSWNFYRGGCVYFGPSVDLAQPQIAKRDLARSALNLQSEEAGEVIRGRRIIVNQNGHELAVEDVEYDAAAGDDGVLVPFAVPDEST